MVDHETIDEAIDAIELLIRRGDLDLLRGAAERFADMLEAHFTHEEASALFTTLPKESEALAAEIGSLIAQHVEMRAEIRALLEGEEIAARLLGLIKRLDAHEKIELGLVERAFSRATRS